MTTLHDLLLEAGVQSAAGRLANRPPPRPPMRRTTPAPRYADLQPLENQFFQQRTEEASRRLMDGPLRRLDDQQAQYTVDPIHTPGQRNGIALSRQVTPGAYDAGNATGRIAQGENAWGDLALNTGMAALPFLGVRGLRGEPAPAPMREPLPSRLRVYHGSPHEFEQFDPAHIGTGEGAQAYGHGLYVAESPDVAQSYREQLAGPGEGHLYEGYLSGRPSEFIDLDQPVRRQTPQVQQFVSDLYDMPLSEVRRRNLKPVIIGEEEAARARQAGFAGLRYFDEGSRAGPGGTRNYVVFDPERVALDVRNGSPISETPNAAEQYRYAPREVPTAESIPGEEPSPPPPDTARRYPITVGNNEYKLKITPQEGFQTAPHTRASVSFARRGPNGESQQMPTGDTPPADALRLMRRITQTLGEDARVHAPESYDWMGNTGAQTDLYNTMLSRYGTPEGYYASSEPRGPRVMRWPDYGEPAEAPRPVAPDGGGVVRQESGTGGDFFHFASRPSGPEDVTVSISPTGAVDITYQGRTSGRGSSDEATRVFRNAFRVIENDIATNARPRYKFRAANERLASFYDRMLTNPPTGYSVHRSGDGFFTLERTPPARGATPPPDTKSLPRRPTPKALQRLTRPSAGFFTSKGNP